MTNIDRDKLNSTYKFHENELEMIMETANKITKPLTAEIEKCIGTVLTKCNEIENFDALNLEELERMAIKIPALCLFLQVKINEYSIKSSVEHLFVNTMVMNELEKIKVEKGEAREKMKRAEAICLNDRIVEELNKQICLNLRDVVTRADKVYEGVKKILDIRMRENEYNRKSQKFSS